MSNKVLQYNAIINSLKVVILAIFPFITIPYVTRILGIENIGKIQFSITFISFFIMAASYGINTYALREGALFKDNKEKLSCFASEMLNINIITTLVSIVILFILTFVFSGLHEYSLIIWILSIQIIFNIINFEWVIKLFEKFSYITLISIVIQLITILFVFILVKNKDDLIIYAIITTISNSSIYIFNFFKARKLINLKVSFTTNWKKHFNSMSIIFFNEITQQIYINSDILMLGIITNNYYVGYYTIPVKIYFLIKKILNSMIAVIIPRLAYYSNKRKKDFLKLLNNTFNIILLIILPISTLLLLLSKDILLVLFGKKFLISSLSLQILSIALIFAVLANIFCNGVLIINKQEKTVLIGVVVSAFINIFLNCALLSYFKHNGAAFTTLISEIFIMTYSFIKSKKYIKNNHFFPNLLKELLGCITIIFVYYLFNQLVIIQSILKIVLVSIIGIILYLLIQFLLKNKYLYAIKEL